MGDRRTWALRTLVAASVMACVGAAPASDRRWCSGVSESSDSSQLKLARVVISSPRVHFISNPGDTARTSECPSSAPACRNRAFLVQGDTVLVDEFEGDFACASYVSARAVETGGWLPKTALEILPTPAPALSDWAGTWRRVEATIQLVVKDGALAAEGEATWGANDPARVRSGAVNIGEFVGVTQPAGHVAAFGAGASVGEGPDVRAEACQVRLRLYGSYLVVEDNRKCGGANVSFAGVFVRARR